MERAPIIAQQRAREGLVGKEAGAAELRLEDQYDTARDGPFAASV
jgi:hypothetical protein